MIEHWMEIDKLESFQVKTLFLCESQNLNLSGDWPKSRNSCSMKLESKFDAMDDELYILVVVNWAVSRFLLGISLAIINHD